MDDGEDDGDDMIVNDDDGYNEDVAQEGAEE